MNERERPRSPDPKLFFADEQRERMAPSSADKANVARSGDKKKPGGIHLRLISTSPEEQSSALEQHERRDKLVLELEKLYSVSAAPMLQSRVCLDRYYGGADKVPPQIRMQAEAVVHKARRALEDYKSELLALAEVDSESRRRALARFKSQQDSTRS